MLECLTLSAGRRARLRTRTLPDPGSSKGRSTGPHRARRVAPSLAAGYSGTVERLAHVALSRHVVLTDRSVPMVQTGTWRVLSWNVLASQLGRTALADGASLNHDVICPDLVGGHASWIEAGGACESAVDGIRPVPHDPVHDPDADRHDPGVHVVDRIVGLLLAAVAVELIAAGLGALLPGLA